MVSEVSKLNRQLRSLQSQKTRTAEKIQYWRNRFSDVSSEIRQTREAIHRNGGTVKRTQKTSSSF